MHIPNIIRIIKNQCNAIYISFLAKNFYNPNISRSNLFLHFVGRSIQKNTELVLDQHEKRLRHCICIVQKSFIKSFFVDEHYFKEYIENFKPIRKDEERRKLYKHIVDRSTTQMINFLKKYETLLHV